MLGENLLCLVESNWKHSFCKYMKWSYVQQNKYILLPNYLLFFHLLPNLFRHSCSVYKPVIRDRRDSTLTLHRPPWHGYGYINQAMVDRRCEKSSGRDERHMHLPLCHQPYVHIEMLISSGLQRSAFLLSAGFPETLRSSVIVIIRLW